MMARLNRMMLLVLGGWFMCGFALKGGVDVELLIRAL
jgi:hypothetical protein